MSLSVYFYFCFICACSSYLTSLNYTYEKLGSNDSFLEFTSFYDTDLKRPYQIVFVYTCEQARQALNTSSPKRPHFTYDPHLSISDQAVDEDYKGSGKTRGHLATAKYFCYNHQSFKNTFFLTNVAPQYQNANELWNKKDETIILTWAANNTNCINNLVVDIATVGQNGTIGKDKVSVPYYYVNSICEPNSGMSVCFIGTNLGNDDEVWYCSVSTCEKMFQIQFFTVPLLSEFNKCLEFKNSVNEDFWDLKKHKDSKFLKKL